MSYFLAQAKELLIDTYQVSEVLDRRICPVCETLHQLGRRFPHSAEISIVSLNSPRLALTPPKTWNA